MEAHGRVRAGVMHAPLGACGWVCVRDHIKHTPTCTGCPWVGRVFLGGDAGRGGCLAIFHTPLPSSRVSRKDSGLPGAVVFLASAYWRPMIAQCICGLFWLCSPSCLP